MSDYSIFNITGGSDRLNNQPCQGILTKNECESSLPLKYITNDFFHQTPQESSNLGNLSRGIFFSDGFNSPSDKIDVNSQVRIGKKNDKKLSGPLGPLPLPTTGSFIGGQGNVIVEDSVIRPSHERNQKSCNPKETSYYDRSFALFPTGIVQNPMENVDCLVQCGPEFRQGVSIKGSTSQKYKRGN
jgi:hypothetical protein